MLLRFFNQDPNNGASYVTSFACSPDGNLFAFARAQMHTWWWRAIRSLRARHADSTELNRAAFGRVAQTKRTLIVSKSAPRPVFASIEQRLGKPAIPHLGRVASCVKFPIYVLESWRRQRKCKTRENTQLRGPLSAKHQPGQCCKPESSKFCHRLLGKLRRFITTCHFRNGQSRGIRIRHSLVFFQPAHC